MSADPFVRLARTRAFLFDMDGTLYVGERALPGAVNLMNAVIAAGRPRLVLTNNSSASRHSYQRRLARLGMRVRATDVLTSGTAAAEWLAASTTLRRPYVLGTRALFADCRRAGLTPTEPAGEPDCVLLGFDKTLRYARLTDACLLVAAGLPYYATHADRTCIDTRGRLPDAGALIAAVEATTRRLPTVLGKPEPSMVQAGLRRLDATAGETLIFGDQLDTDIALGVRSGILAALALTGETSPERLRTSSVQPDVVFADAAALLAALRSAGALPAP